ncbi:Trimeric GatFAB AmidoTransferase(AdT) complex subunit [Cadophora gregata]|uniref:Trimeric GatFAB AmidoTransferase(AdT) complex subunit n=1 Tax=Cadophora gregata TaxID=51156 RepID=UPI0026DB2632|nr:Trimeric GatFAB AmidoTransferase(AdT) complex subunit [Cadophora gregata]KAK0105361.1 Trimeric GatFAB AmidoTransferase(AdT) complex subunit [Cadophora gregata f. sp. sojae]KAK0105742.1 Trimeric GatFAB AmidoTransferase(AdT) complex subunit [Cadophora gregata]
MKIIRKVYTPPLAAKAERPALNVFITTCGRFLPVPLPKAWIGKPVLVAVKDNITTQGSRTTCASAILKRHKSPFPAEVVRRLQSGRQSVAIIGKTNMDEFGMGSHSTKSFFSAVQNKSPLHDHSVGGSSGGSAVAVATDQCLAALGTDTGGSVRLPAAYTGIVGFKPSYGMVSRWGVIPYANSLDTVGLLASDVKLTRNAFRLINRFDPKDPTSITEASRTRMEEKRVMDVNETYHRHVRAGEVDTSKSQAAFPYQKIGVPLEYNIAELDPAIREAWQRALQLFQDNGATIVPVSLPNTKHALSAYYVLAPAEAASNLSKYDGVRYGSRSGANDGEGDVLYSNTRGAGFGDEVKRRILLGAYTLSSEAIDNYFIKAQKVRRLVQRDFDQVFAISNPLRPAEQFDLSNLDESIKLDDKHGPAQVDFIVCPTAPTLPPTQKAVMEESPVNTYMNDVFTVPASLAGLPAISIPFPIMDEYKIAGRPNFTAIQMIGQYSDDDRVLGAAKRLEQLIQATTATAPAKKPLIKFHHWERRKHQVRPKVRKVMSVELPTGGKTRLRVENWKAKQRQKKDAKAMVPEAVEAEAKRADEIFEDALKTWETLKPQSIDTQKSSDITHSGKPDLDKTNEVEFHVTFSSRENSMSSKKPITSEAAKADLDTSFDTWDSKKEKSQEKGMEEQRPADPKEERSQNREGQEPATRDDKAGEKGYYD